MSNHETISITNFVSQMKWVLVIYLVLAQDISYGGGNGGLHFIRDSEYIAVSNFWNYLGEINLEQFLESLKTSFNFLQQVKNTIRSGRNKAEIKFDRINSQFENLQTRTELLIEKITLPEDNKLSSRSRRSLLLFIGKLQQKFYGTASIEEVKQLAYGINQLTEERLDITSQLNTHTHILHKLGEETLQLRASLNKLNRVTIDLAQMVRENGYCILGDDIVED